MYSGQFDGASASSLFSGGGFMPSQSTQTTDAGFSKSRASQSTQTTDAGFSKSRASQGVLPLTVKQISEAYHSNDDKANFVVDGVDASTVRLLGIVMNKAERVTDVSFSLDDGTGKIDVNRWVNETSDTNEMALIQNGMYVMVNGSLKGFQGKRHVVAFSVRPVAEFDHNTLHFLECIHVHLQNTRSKPQMNAGTGISDPGKNDYSGLDTSVSNQVPANLGTGGDIYKIVLDLFQEPASLAREHGLHVNEITEQLRLPEGKIRDAIEYHVDVGNIYSTIDENHYKSACNG